MLIGRVSALWRYPVKSMLGETTTYLDIDRRGVVADRQFAIRNANGKFGSGKTTRRFQRIDGLFRFAARLDGETAVIRFPNGTEMSGADPAIHDALSAALGEPVTLAPEGSVSHFDEGPLHLVTSAGLCWLAARLPEGQIEARRFRPNIVLDIAGATVPVEHGWIGCILALGAGLRIRVSHQTERCVMVTNPQNGLSGDPRILRELAEVNDACFGVYAAIVDPGRVRVGDEVTILACAP